MQFCDLSKVQTVKQFQSRSSLACIMHSYLPFFALVFSVFCFVSKSCLVKGYSEGQALPFVIVAVFREITWMKLFPAFLSSLTLENKRVPRDGQN